MSRMFYLLNLRVDGIKNIEKPLDFEFYKKTINKNFNPEDYKIKAIYGENGSGKTGIVVGVDLIRNLILDNNYLADNATQKILSELVNKKKKRGEIEVEFFAFLGEERIILKYSVAFEVREDSRFYLVSEKLDRKNGNYSKNQYENIYSVSNGELSNFKVEKDNFELYKKASLNLLEQQTFIACIQKIKQPVFSENIYRKELLLLMFFALSLITYIDENDNHISYYLNEELKDYGKEKITQKKELELFQDIKTKILEVNAKEKYVKKLMFSSYEEYVKRLFSFIKIFKPDLCNIEIEKKDYNETFYKCYLKMVYKDYILNQEFESRGIKKLVQLFNYLDAASKGEIVFIDELDSNINDVYLDKLIEYFALYGKGQLCFTAHNLSPMSVLKKYRNSICFISSINTVHTWTKNGNQNPENAYKNGFIEDSPFNVDSSDFLGILGWESDE